MLVVLLYELLTLILVVSQHDALQECIWVCQLTNLLLAVLANVEAAFRAKIAEGLQAQLVGDSDYKFLLDVRAHCEKKVGKLEFPDALLKRIMLANNKDKGEDFVEKNYEESLKELTWHLIKEQLIKAQDIKINDEDVKETAKEAARA